MLYSITNKEVLTKKRVPRDLPPTYVTFTDGIHYAYYKDMKASW